MTNESTAKLDSLAPKEISRNGPLWHSIPSFPFGAPDERIDSRVGRYHCLEGCRGVDMTYRRLFDSAIFFLGQPIPSRLDRLARKLPGDLDTNLEDLYHRSTLLPLFEQFGGDRFHEKDRRTLLLSLSNHARSAGADVVVTCFCMQCLAADEEEYGWPYIHRAHHVPGVTACWRHEINLVSQCANCGCPFQPPTGLALGLWRGCASCGALPTQMGNSHIQRAQEIEVQYARFVKGMLDVAPIRVSSENLANLYRHQALATGYGKKTLINRAALIEEIEAKFGSALLMKFDPDYKTINSDAWFHVLGRGRQNGEVPICRHLFLSMFLFNDADTLINQLRLLAAGKLAQVSSAKASRRNRHIGAHTTAKSSMSNLLNEIVTFARSENLNIDGLWKMRYGDMKRLIRKQPDVIKVLQERIGKEPSKTETTQTRSSSKPLNQDDEEWAKKIAEVVPNLYDPDKIPKRVTINTIAKAAGFPRFVDSVWSPLTYAAMKKNAETVWHFYARRLLWNMRQQNGKPAGRWKIIYGMDFYRATEVFNSLEYKLTELCKSEVPICEALESIGVNREWPGPCPGKEIRRAGRAYQKNQSVLIEDAR